MDGLNGVKRIEDDDCDERDQFGYNCASIKV